MEEEYDFLAYILAFIVFFLVIVTFWYVFVPIFLIYFIYVLWKKQKKKKEKKKKIEALTPIPVTKKRVECPRCKSIISTNDKFCPYCGFIV